MEVIRIPQVSLVDATGRRIGVFNDDPDWWQQLKLKHQNANNSNQMKKIKDAAQYNRSDSVHEVNILNEVESMGSRTKLISAKESGKHQLNNATANEQTQTTQQQQQLQHKGKKPTVEDMSYQCNVIGETPLHIAIMYNDFETIRFLIEKKGFNVNQRSVGGKFSGGFNSRTTASLIEQSKYEGLAYYGEYPLSFSACFASKEIYDYLIDNGADPNLQDTYGNTVLHVLVINNKLDMFQYATNHPKKKALLTIKNSQDLTPVNLAAKLGRKDLFSKMLELRNMEFWRYSNITCSAYPLEGLDTVDAEGKIAWNAALSYIVNGETEAHLDMLEIGVVKRLLEDKWSTYAQRRLLQRLALSTMHLIFLSIAVYTRAGDYDNLDIWPPTTGNTVVRYISEIAVILGCLAIMFMNAQEIYGQGFIYFLKNLKGEPANVFYTIFCVLVLVAIPFRFVSFGNTSGVTARNVEDTLVIIAVPCGWVHLLFYARVVTITGPFVVMIYKMIIGDILTFASIYGFLLFGFSLGFYYLYKNVQVNVTTMDSYPEALMITFQMTLGEFKARLPEFDQIYYSDFTKVVFVAFLILMHILLLNMLIAMMGNTYHQIIKKSEKEWRKQWAHIVLLLERSFSPQELRKFQDQYCIKLPSKDPAKKEDLVALMVIKKAPKTKAFQKTTCIKNWKRFCKNVLGLLKKNSCNASKLLEIWANKDKKPLKTPKETDKNMVRWLSTASKLGAASAAFTANNNSRPALNNNIEVKEPPSEKKNSKTNETTPFTTSSSNKADNNVNQKKMSNGSNNNNKVGVMNTESKPAVVESKPPLPPPPPSTTTTSQVVAKDEKGETTTQQQQLQVSSSSSSASSSSSRANSATLLQPRHTSTIVVTRNINKKTFFPNQTSKIYPVTATSASSVNPEVEDSFDMDYLKKFDFTGTLNTAAATRDDSTTSAGGDSRRPIYPRFPQMLQTESSESDLMRTNDTASDTLSSDSKTNDEGEFSDLNRKKKSS